MCHTISGGLWSRTGGSPSSPWAPQGRTGFSSELLSLHLHQASRLRPEAAGTRRGQPSRPPQARLPLLEQAGPPLPPSHNCQQGSPAHTCHGGLHSQPRPGSSPPIPPAGLRRRAHGSDVGRWKQEVANKVVTNKVLSGASNFPFHLSSSLLWRLGRSTQWPPLWPDAGTSSRSAFFGAEA